MPAIPKVRRWTVRYYLDRILLAEVIVEAPNKRFARWAARDRVRDRDLQRYIAANRETVSLTKERLAR